MSPNVWTKSAVQMAAVVSVAHVKPEGLAQKRRVNAKTLMMEIRLLQMILARVKNQVTLPVVARQGLAVRELPHLAWS